jgi:hypothetical protein
MSSRWETFCTAVLDDLLGNVQGLYGALPHKLAPWDPEHLQAEAGERHLAVYPVAEAVDEAIPLVTDGGTALVQQYRILYWEDAGDESSRGIADEAAAADLYTLAEDVIDRFYLRTNVFLGSTEFTQYVGMSLPDRAASVRWFQITVRARTSQALA